MPLHHVAVLLGHASIGTTHVYLNADKVHLRESMERVEAGRSGKQVANAVAATASQVGHARPTQRVTHW